MKRLINLTPNPVTIFVDDKEVTIPKSDVVSRCGVDTVTIGSVSVDGVDIPITRTQFGVVENLPDAVDGTLLIVSMPVAMACPDRSDLIVPFGVVLDDDNNIIGYDSFVTV